VSRRDVLKIGVFTAAGVAVGGALGFLGGSGSRQQEVDSLTARLNAITKVYNLPDLAPEVRMLNWTLYTNYALLDAFVDRFGVEMVYDEGAESQDDFRTRLKAGNPEGFDLMIVTDYAVQEVKELGLLEKLNHDYIPNIDLIDSGFETPWDPAHEYSLPYLWGTTGIGWNTALATLPQGKTRVNSWSDLFDTSPNSFLRLNERKVTVQADRDEALAAAAIYNGKDVNDLSPGTLDLVKQTLIDVKPYIFDFADATTYYAGLSDESFMASHAWSGDVLFVRETVPKPEITYVVPDEGAHLWTDNYVIPKNAPHKETAMVFINYMWEASNAAVLAMFRNYMIANKLALYGGAESQRANVESGEPIGMILPHVLTLPDINPLTDALDDPDRAPRMQRLQARTPAQNDMLAAIWEEIQAAP